MVFVADGWVVAAHIPTLFGCRAKIGAKADVTAGDRIVSGPVLTVANLDVMSAIALAPIVYDDANVARFQPGRRHRAQHVDVERVAP